MTDPHQPTSEFVNALGHDLQSALRRQETFGETGTPRATREFSGRFRLLWCMAVVAGVSICLGGAAAVAVVKKQDRRMADLNIARATTQLDLAERRAYSFHFEFDYSFSFGFGDPLTPKDGDELEQSVERDDVDDAAEVELTALELERRLLDIGVELRKLDLKEVTLTGRVPNDSLSAPLVDDRDFVSERLELELDIAIERLDLLMLQAVAEGLDELDRLTLVGEIELAKTHVAQFVSKIDSRDLYLDGDLSAGELEWQKLHEDAVYKARKASLELERAQHALKREKNGRGLGLQSLELRVRNAELQLQIAELDVATVQQRSTSDENNK